MVVLSDVLTNDILHLFLTISHITTGRFYMIVMFTYIHSGRQRALNQLSWPFQVAKTGLGPK